MNLRRLKACLVLAELVALITGLLCAFSGSTRADYTSTVLSDAPATYYRLGELSGSTASDSSGNGHQGTYYNVALGQPGAILSDPSNTSASFNGTNSLVDTNYSVLDPSFTIEAWVRPAQAVAEQQLIAGFSGEMQLLYNGNDQPGVAESSFFNGSVFERTDTTVTLPLNTWTYLAGTWNNSTKALSIYVNGVLDSAINFPGDTTQTLGLHPFFQIGGFDESLHGGSYKAQYFNGGIDETAYYSTALSASRIQAHYLAAVPEPSTAVILIAGAISCSVMARRFRRKMGAR